MKMTNKKDYDPFDKVVRLRLNDEFLKQIDYAVVKYYHTYKNRSVFIRSALIKELEELGIRDKEVNKDDTRKEPQSNI